MLLISRSMDLRRYAFLPYVRLINCHFHLFRSSASYFSSQYLLLFLKSKELCSSSSYSFHFRYLSFNDIMMEAISPQNMTNFYVWYYLEVPSSLLFVQELVHLLLSLAILSSPFSFSTTFQSSPNISAPIFLVFKFSIM